MGKNNENLIVKKKLNPVYLYDKQGKKQKFLHAIDAREAINTGDYSKHPPELSEVYYDQGASQESETVIASYNTATPDSVDNAETVTVDLPVDGPNLEEGINVGLPPSDDDIDNDANPEESEGEGSDNSDTDETIDNEDV